MTGRSALLCNGCGEPVTATSFARHQEHERVQRRLVVETRGYLLHQRMLEEFNRQNGIADSSTASWMEAYRRSRIGQPTAAKLAHPAAPTAVGITWHTAGRYAQGMARGYWWEQPAGRHPGYRMADR